MQPKRKRGTRTYSQSEGNLALVDVSQRVFQQPNAKPLSPVLRVVQGIPVEDTDTDALAPATGIIAGIGLSIMTWCLIILIIIWVVPETAWKSM